MGTCTCGDGDDWLLCRECLKEREGKAVAADRARIAKAIRDESAVSDYGHWYAEDVRAFCVRLLRVVEGG